MLTAGRPREYKNDAEKQRAYRIRVKNKKLATKAECVRSAVQAATGQNIDKPPTLIDTREWSWPKWMKEYQNKKPLKHQIESLESFDEGPTLDNVPRQHGKTTYSVEPFLLRRVCCESVFYHKDKPGMYISNSAGNVKKMIGTIRDQLYFNKKILANYGDLIDYSMIRGRQSKVSQTQFEINLTTNRDITTPTLRGLSIDSRIRGGNTFWTVVDDPIDIREELDPIGATVKFMEWFKAKIVPLTKGNFLVIGTRYNTNDVYIQLAEMGIFKHIQRKAIIGTIPSYTLPERRADRGMKPHEIEIHGDVKLLAPELWATEPTNPLRTGTPGQNILFTHNIMGDRVFNQEYQQNPRPLNPELKPEWLRPTHKLPVEIQHMKKGVFMDTATGQTKDADYNGLVFGAAYQRQYLFLDVIYGRWTPLAKIKKIEGFVETNAERFGIDRTEIPVYVEVVRDRDFYNLMLEHSWISPKSRNPRGRGLKQDRIRNNLGGEMEVGRVWVHEDCRNKKQLKEEVENFPLAKHEHIIDAGDQLIYEFKGRRGIKGGAPITF